MKSQELRRSDLCNQRIFSPFSSIFLKISRSMAHKKSAFSPSAAGASSGGSGRGSGHSGGPIFTAPIGVDYTVDPLFHRHHFEFASSANLTTQFCSTTDLSAYKLLKERREKLIRYSPATVREIITYTPFEAMNREALEKPAFLFGDAMEHSDEILFKEEIK